ncbi:FG-GAP repeat-containing protein [Chitinophaga rupis]|uniref:FG-GAP repeat-containing protein n=1 Tax=Chitinophaga rupis TaxID=573321 RepID=A0A1H7RG61_9BACT|nr:FG-GAP-like repeat-containing protein [Chitinophaga rupis]SEL59069.1 FG-GAP repeat-containing protein [Chitinophaga rupis]
MRVLIILLLMALSAHAQTGQSFVPDGTFSGSALGPWHVLGAAKWQAQNGTLTGTANGNSGWLVLDSSYQDVGLHAQFKCTPGTEAGFLFRMETKNDSTKGVLVSLKDSGIIIYSIVLNTQGKELLREPLRSAGSIVRLAPPPDPRGSSNNNNNNRNRRAGGPELPLQRPETALRPNGWNTIEIFIDASIIRSFLNDGRELGAAAADDAGLYGPIALYVGNGTAQFKAIGWKDLAQKIIPQEATGPRFQVQRINDMYYSWGAAAADFNKDGYTDIVAGPYIYFGPDYTRLREIFPASAYNPSKEFTEINCQYTYDFNADGWPDIFTGPPRATVYLNPKGASRRWDKFEVIPSVQTEITVFRDLDGDGEPELVYGAEGTLRYAKPDPADPSKPWVPHIISGNGYMMGHGIGTGDINGDGRTDIVNPNGWWEQPATDNGQPWPYHPAALARYGHRSTGAGGAVMAVYDVNGDAKNDVVTSLNAHGFGLAWFEQTQDSKGNITFTQHLIMDDYSSKNAGDVTFSQIHGTTAADVDGDGIPDFIAGKRYWSHLDNYFDPDPYGAPVLYWFRTVRDTKAPGGATFVPELVHNRSGAGSDILAADLDKDGRVDIITSTDRGTFIFWNKRK